MNIQGSLRRASLTCAAPTCNLAISEFKLELFGKVLWNREEGQHEAQQTNFQSGEQALFACRPHPKSQSLKRSACNLQI
jgi:hypothetical protein